MSRSHCLGSWRGALSLPARAGTTTTTVESAVADGDLDVFVQIRSRTVLVQRVAATKKMAEDVTMIAFRLMLYARLPNVKGTAGGVAFVLDEVLPASAANSLDPQSHHAG